MINELVQWAAILFLLYPKVHQVVIDFKKEEEEE